jgi:hypothetical protein
MIAATLLSPRLVGQVACTLAALMAAGASTPRLRAPGRERVRSGVVRPGTLRTDDCRGWVAPDADHDLEISGAETLVCRQDGPPGDDQHSPNAVAFGAPAHVLPATPAARHSPIPARPPRRLTAGLIRAAAGRAPPLA